MRASSSAASKLLLFAACASLLTKPVWSAPPATPKVSEFAPAADLLAQVDFYINRVSDSLADADAFDMAKQSRTFKAGNTLAALALVLANHDEDFPAKPAMGGMLRAAQRLAAAEGDFAVATGALNEIKAARAGTAAAGPAVPWEKSAHLGALMKQVPLIHAPLKRGVGRDRLKRQAAQSAGQAAALAAIAQAAMFDVEYVKNPADVDKWYACCADMRDAAGAVNAGIHAADAERVDAGMMRLFQSCESCHASFRAP